MRGPPRPWPLRAPVGGDPSRGFAGESRGPSASACPARACTTRSPGTSRVGCSRRDKRSGCSVRLNGDWVRGVATGKGEEMPKARAGSRSDLRFHIPPAGDGSGLEAATQVAEQTREFQRRLDALSGLIPQREERQERRRTALVDAVGEEASERLRSFSREQRQSNYGLGAVALDREGMGRLNEARRAAHRASLDLMRDVGVDPERVRALHDEFGHDVIASATSDDPFEGDAPDTAAFGPPTRDDVLGEAGPVYDPTTLDDGGEPWNRRMPPFDGWAWSYDLRWRGGSDPRVDPEEGADGDIGLWCGWENMDAGDDDFLWGWLDGAVGFWYYTPREGQMEVEARFGPFGFFETSPAGSISLEDEWGWSSSTAYMSHGASVWVTPSSPLQLPGREWRLEAGGTPDEASSYSVRGPTSLIVRGRFEQVPGPAWVWIKAQSFSWLDLAVDDVSIRAGLNGIWHVSEVSVRMI